MTINAGGLEEHARAFWVAAPGRGEIRAEILQTPGAGDVLVRTLFSGISRGTESLVFTGRVPVSEHTRMRAPFQCGDFPTPVKYGYTNVGVVEVGPAALRGRTVFSLYPHQTRFVVPESAVHVLPETLPPDRAVLASNLETALNGVWDGEPQPGSRVVVLGAGTVGCLVAWLIQHTVGSSCVLSDINPRRADVARALGVRFALPQDLADTAADLVVHTSGSPAGLVRALDLAAPDGTILEMSWFGDQIVSLPLGGAFHSRRLTIRSSQVGGIPPRRRADWTYRSRMQEALRLLADPVLDVLITGESHFDDLPAVMAALVTNPGDALCHRIRY